MSTLGLPAELLRSLTCNEYDAHRASRHPQCEASEFILDRFVQDRRGHDEAKKGFRRFEAYKRLPALRLALAAHYEKETNNRALVQNAKAG